MIRSLLLVGACALSVGAVMAQSDPIATRKATMKGVGDANAEVTKISKGEAPFNLAHLRNMTAVTEMGGIIFPPLPALYHHPKSIEEMVAETVERVLDLCQLPGATPQAWLGLKQG